MRVKTTRLNAVAAMLLALVLSLGVAACGDDDDGDTTSGGEGPGQIESNADNGKVSLTIGSKNFPEQEILGEIYAQALAAAGYNTSTDLNLGSETVALKTLKSGQISGYPEYASTALTSFFGLEPEEVPADAIHQRSDDQLDEQHGEQPGSIVEPAQPAAGARKDEQAHHQHRLHRGGHLQEARYDRIPGPCLRNRHER